MIKAERRPPSEHHNESPLQCISRLLQDNSLIVLVVMKGFPMTKFKMNLLMNMTATDQALDGHGMGGGTFFPSRNYA